MSYSTVRRAEVHGSFDRRLTDFAAEFDPSGRTIVLLPGGMGSQLNRSARKYKEDAAGLEDYRPLWITLGLLFGDAPKLAIGEDDRDEGGHMIVPDGPLRFLLMDRPYDATERFFRQRGFNFIVFGYDWRRPVAESAAFCQEFLGRMRAKISNVHGVDPLPSTTLLCHSMGGLVAKLLLHRVIKADMSEGEAADEAAGWFERIITVGTPFYGTSDHVVRYYKGQYPLNRVYPPSEVARVAASLPGPYILLFLDRQTFEEEQETLGLEEFPVRDGGSGGDADFHDPELLSRFPEWVSRKHLRDAAKVQQAISRRMPAAVMERFFNVRSGNNPNTAVKWVWNGIDAGEFDWDEADASVALAGSADAPAGECGDGTVPYWSARLAAVAGRNVYGLRQAFDHGTLLEHGETLAVVRQTIEAGELPAEDSPPVSEHVSAAPRASRAELEAYLSDIAEERLTVDDPAAMDRPVLRRLIEELNP